MALVVLAAVLFLAHGWQTIGAPFGDSHDGRNAAVWAGKSQELREQGPIDSRLGARSSEMGTYADHPPLIALETAAAEAIGGPVSAVTRAPAWLGTLVALALLARLLYERGLSPGAVGSAVVLVVATPMVLTYGTMLDTPVTSLPFGLGLLLVWQRALDGKRVRLATAAVLAALAVLAGWQSFLVAALVGVWGFVGLCRRTRRPIHAVFAGGGLAGLGLLLGWLLWAYGGDLGPLIDMYLFRSGNGEGPIGPAQLAQVLRKDLGAMFGVILVLALAGLVVALRNRRTRTLALAGLAVTIPYALAFPLGVANHDYWNYWFVLPMAVGLGAGIDWLTGRLGGTVRSELLAVGSASLVAVLLAIGLSVRPSDAQRLIHGGLEAGRLSEEVEFSAQQQDAWYAGAVGTPAPWLAYATGRDAVLVMIRDLPRLASEHPDDLVLVGRTSCATGQLRRAFSFERAAEVALRPPILASCP